MRRPRDNEDEDDAGWASGLCDCGGNVGFCLGACLCPDIAYGLNYARAIGSGDDDICSCTGLLPGVVTLGLCDLLPALLVRLVDPTRSSYSIASLSCLIRQQHRRVLFHDESLACALCKECFCAPCSLAQVRRAIVYRNNNNNKTNPTASFFASTNSLLGFIAPRPANRMLPPSDEDMRLMSPER